MMLLIAVITFLFFIVFKDISVHEIINNLRKTNFNYILLAFICAIVFVVCESLNLYRLLKALKCPINCLSAFKFAAIGFFFSSITPSSSGGEPAQLLFMSKNKIPLPEAYITLLIELFTYQFVTCLIAVFGFIYNYELLINNIGNIRYLVFLGLIINFLIMLFLLFMIFTKKIATKIAKLIYLFLKKISYKNAENFYHKLLNHIKKYHQCSIYIKKNKKLLIKNIITEILRMLAYYSITYFVYRSFGLKDYNVLTIILLQSVLYISVSSLPLPGAMGASEGAFLKIFRIVFGSELLSSAMVISRAISFYLLVIFTGISLFFFIILEKKNNKTVHKSVLINKKIN